MKRMVAAVVGAACLLTATGCGTFYETSPSTYKKALKYIDYPEYFPESLDGYTINRYAFTRYEYMDTCVEVFVELMVDSEQLQTLLLLARQAEGMRFERSAYYAQGYQEIVFSDSYQIHEDVERVGNADIRKVIYNERSGNVIYEYFDAFDTGVYELKDLAYFNRFAIDQQEYSVYITEEKA